jgi:alcohol dehydrogenase YqhD (iron-dependent ADH family)
MNPFIFHNPVRVYFGEGAAKHESEEKRQELY